jgi:protein-tyrosine kinase
LIETGEDGALKTPGIVERVAAGKDISDALADKGHDLFVGRWMAGASGRSVSGRVIQDKNFWDVLSKTFALIVIDAPALQTSSDGIAFAQASHQTVMVVEAETTRKEVADNLHHTLVSANATVAGVVMNKRKFYIPEKLYKHI